MITFIAICLPKELITKLVAESRSTLAAFLENELPKIVDQYEDMAETIWFDASSEELLIKILSWTHPDLHVIHVRREMSKPIK